VGCYHHYVACRQAGESFELASSQIQEFDSLQKVGFFPTIKLKLWIFGRMLQVIVIV